MSVLDVLIGIIDLMFLGIVVFIIGASVWYGIKIDIGKGRIYFELYPLRRFFVKEEEREDEYSE